MTETPVNDSDGRPLGFDELPEAPLPRTDVTYLPDLGFQTYYDLLEVSPSSTEADLKTAYRETIKRIHPDRSDNPHAQFLMARLQEARTILLDTETRKTYHAVGHWRFIKQHTDREVSIPSHATIEPIGAPIPDLLPARPKDIDQEADAAATSESSTDSGGLTGGLTSLKESVLGSPTESIEEPGESDLNDSEISGDESARQIQDQYSNRNEAGDVIDELLEGGEPRKAETQVYNVSREFDSALAGDAVSEARFTSIKRLNLAAVGFPLFLLGAGFLLAPLPLSMDFRLAILLIVAPLVSLGPVIGFRYIAPELIDDIHRERVRSPNSRVARLTAFKYSGCALVFLIGSTVLAENGTPWTYLAGLLETGGAGLPAPWIDMAAISAPSLTLPVNIIGGLLSGVLPLLGISAGMHAFVLEPLHERLVTPEYRVIDIPNAMGAACTIMALVGLFTGVFVGSALLGGGLLAVLASALGFAGIVVIAGFSA